MALIATPARAQLPVITPVTIYGQVGVPITPVQLQATNSPTSFLAADEYGLVVSSSGLITGTPTRTSNISTVSLLVQATNAFGTSERIQIPVAISPVDFVPVVTSAQMGLYGAKGNAPPYSRVRIVLLSSPLPWSRYGDDLNNGYGVGVDGDGHFAADSPIDVNAGTYTFAAELVYPGTRVAVPNMRGPSFSYTVPQRPGVPVISNVTINGQVGVPITPVTLSVTNSATSITLAQDLYVFGFRLDGNTITGTPNVAVNGRAYTIAATNAAGDADPGYVTLNIAPAAPAPVFPGSNGDGTFPFRGKVTVSINVPSYARLRPNPTPGVINLALGSTGTSNTDFGDLGQGVSFFAFFNIFGSTVTWQWSKDGVTIPGATTSAFSIADAEPASNGRYSCTASDGILSDTWATQLEVRNPPVVSWQTATLATKFGDPMHLAVKATTQGGPILFQWLRDGAEIPGATAGSQLEASTTGREFSSGFDVDAMSVADVGSYSCRVTAYGGTTDSSEIATSLVPIQFVTQPSTVTVRNGEPVHLQVEAKSFGAWMTFQWYHDGNIIPGATNGSVPPASSVQNDGGPIFVIGANSQDTLLDLTSVLDVPAAAGYHAGDYSCRVSISRGSFDSESAQVAVTTQAHLVNLSTRVQAGGTAGTPICGFVVGGDQTLPVLVRGVGPTLGLFGLSDTLPTPTVKLHSPDGSITPFSGWAASRASDMSAVGAFGLKSGSNDAATFLTLGAGMYSADVTDANSATGVVLLETYDASDGAGANTKLINASTLGFVGKDDKAMFTGFVVKGAGSVKILIRAVGPSLAAFGINDRLADPRIQVFQGTSVLADNDDWGTRSDGVPVAIIQNAAGAVNAFSINANSKDAAILRDFTEGTYSAQISGVNGAIGTAIVELYVVP